MNRHAPVRVELGVDGTEVVVACLAGPCAAPPSLPHLAVSVPAAPSKPGPNAPRLA
jgi:hypothetical protein